ncbi:putative transmembrane protein [Senna tora]|uniref:Putative transmembrane protein n=1 Tax=Senna tora TaxID=362788 RepID=A0A834WJ45_9FABA|nr:putative transmembrane protein [Senna tora]
MSILVVHASVNFPTFKSFFIHEVSCRKQTLSFSPLQAKLPSFHQRGFKLRAYGERWCFLGEDRRFKNGVFLEERRFRRKKKRMVLVKNNQGFGFNGGGRDNGSTARLLANLALAIGLTYLSMTGQLGWILDAIVSIWIFAVLIPVVGLGAFLWWAGRDIMQGTCPNCGNEFQVFKSSLNDDLQLCPFCGQPFSVVGNEFVKESVKFSNQSTTFGQAFNDFTRSRNGKDSGRAIDVEAEVKDVE